MSNTVAPKIMPFMRSRKKIWQDYNQRSFTWKCNSVQKRCNLYVGTLRQEFMHTFVNFKAYSFVLVSSVWSRKMFYGNTCKGWQTAQRLVCHHDLFSQIEGLKKSMNERHFSCFSAAFGCKVWKSANCSEYNLFQKLVHVIFIVAGDANFLDRHFCAILNKFYKYIFI